MNISVGIVAGIVLFGMYLKEKKIKNIKNSDELIKAKRELAKSKVGMIAWLGLGPIACAAIFGYAIFECGMDPATGTILLLASVGYCVFKGISSAF